MGTYDILKERELVEVDLATRAAWTENNRFNTHVADTSFSDGTRVSTVFLGLNHAYDDGPPQVFETVIFGGPLTDEGRRYTFWTAAEEGHREFVERVLETGTTVTKEDRDHVVPPL